MRILFVIGQFFPVIGGAESQALKLANALILKGIDITILTIHRPGLKTYEVYNGLKIIRISKYTRGPIKYLFSALSLFSYIVLNGKKFSCLHVHGFSYLAFCTVAASRLIQVPTIAKITNSGSRCDIDRFCSNKFIPDCLKLWAIRRCTRYIAITPLIADELIHRGIKKQQVTCIPNGVILNPVKYSHDAVDNEPQGVLRLLCISRLVPQKNISFLIRVMSKLRIKYQLIVLGDGVLRTRLEEEVRDQELSEQIIFRGFVTHLDLLKEITKSDLFLMPSREEGLSNALLEAMSNGIPLLVSRHESFHYALGNDLFEKYSCELLEDVWEERITHHFHLSHGSRVHNRDDELIKRSKAFCMTAVAENYLRLYNSL